MAVALWHTPKILGIRLDGEDMQFIPKDSPPRYYPGAGGYWTLDLDLVKQGEAVALLPWNRQGVTRVKATVTTADFSFEIKGQVSGQSDLKGAAGGAAVGLLAAGVVGALAGAAVGGSGGNVPVAVSFNKLPSLNRELKLLVVGSENFVRDMQSNAAATTALTDW